MKNGFSPELRLMRLSLTQEAQPLDCLLHEETIDWSVFERMLAYHETGNYLYGVFKTRTDIVPSQTRDALFNRYYSTIRGNILREREYWGIYAAFQAQGMDILPMKGVALLYDIYNESYLRPMNDVDVLAPEKDYERAGHILRSLGYKKDLEGLSESYWRLRQCHVVFHKRPQNNMPMTVELHWSLDFKRRGREILPGLWRRIRESDCAGGKVKLLSVEDTLFSLALHQRRYGKVLCLKYAVDTAMLLRKYKDKIDWDYVLGACRQERIASCFYFLLFQAGFFFGSDEFSAILRKVPAPESKKGLIRQFILRNMDSCHFPSNLKSNYLKAHFLFYDSYIEPAKYIVNIPLEQFAKFYNLEAYSRKTKVLYRIRFFYIILKWITGYARDKQKKNRLS